MKKLLLLILTVILGTSMLVSSHASALTAQSTITTWSWNGNNYHDFEWLFSPIIDPSPQSFLWTYQFYFNNGTTQEKGIFSIQNEGTNPAGKVAKYSVWDASGYTEVKGGYGGSFSNNGKGYYVAINYPWTVGKTYRMEVKADGGVAQGAAWGAFIVDTSNGAATQVGEINIPLAWKGLGSTSSEQTQYLGPSISNCGALAHSEVKFLYTTADALTGNNPGTQQPRSHSNANGAGDCNNSSISDIANGVQQDMGNVIPTNSCTSNCGSNTNHNPPPPPPGSSTGSSTSGSSTGSFSSSFINSLTGGQTGSSTTTKPPTNKFSGSVPFTRIQSSATSLTNIKGGHGSALKTVASVSGLIVLMGLVGWGGYLLFVRYYSKKQLFARTNGMDSDLMIDKASPITKRPPPNDPDITASVLATKPTEQKLTKDEYIEFGQEVLLLEELKDVDKPKPPAPTDPNSDKSA